MEAKMFLFALRDHTKEDGVFSHLNIAPTVGDVYKRFEDDLNILFKDFNSEKEKNDLLNIKKYLTDCSVWCLGSVDFLSGELVPHLEEYGRLIDVLEVLKNE